MEIARHPKFDKKLRRIPPSVRRALADRLELFLANQFNPLLHNHPLSGQRKGEWSINITSDWRLIYEPISSSMILLTDIDTHHNLYGT